MNLTRIALAALAALVAYFIVGSIFFVIPAWSAEFAKYPAIYRTGEAVNLTHPADRWRVVGCGARLPGDISSCGTWAQLTSAHGTAGQGSTEFGPASVSLRALRGFSFTLNVNAEQVGSLEVAPNLNRVPGTAKTTVVWLGR